MTERIIKDKVIVITGAAGGIGEEIAVNFVKKGAKVILLDKSEQNGNKLKEKLNLISKDKAVFFKCDITTDLDIMSKQIFDLYDVDVLINNAGVTGINKDSWKECIDINLNFLIGWSLKFYEHMRKDLSGQGGTIINLGSIFSYRVVSFAPAYQASKFGVLGFTKSLGHESNYNRSGVRVIAVCPGYTDTNLGRADTLGDDVVDAAKEHYKLHPHQKPEAVGRAAVEVFEKADSGIAWVIEGGREIEQIV